ncbi:hypothetical protein [Kiloniella sp. b19]|uniref:hypothetical protein n=1 Tax=Kiloniella sp. GXU_MW_B19 TaxID=3141326 RepID=UPI0031DEA022
MTFKTTFLLSILLILSACQTTQSRQSRQDFVNYRYDKAMRAELILIAQKLDEPGQAIPYALCQQNLVTGEFEERIRAVLRISPDLPEFKQILGTLTNHIGKASPSEQHSLCQCRSKDTWDTLDTGQKTAFNKLVLGTALSEEDNAALQRQTSRLRPPESRSMTNNPTIRCMTDTFRMTETILDLESRLGVDKSGI